ncbi:unnamed protein product [Notodromas monacha]|uniref:Sec20 C-terminal domain-containing protein n=1 Tax=Notodromas monacha TaxID=399045 RepID=A0A7R9GG99_9CRUS|nr:unnamed protein product [Notodromas monacha]CAG0919987.1 unnamed protein product [Notodromas monacha]
MDSAAVKALLQDIVEREIRISSIIRRIGDGQVDNIGLLDLNQDIRAETKILREKLRDLDDAAVDCPAGEDRDMLMKESKKHCIELTNFRTALRKANLQCQMSISNRNAEELFRTKDGYKLKVRREERSKESIANSAADVTNDLRAIARVMAEQVDRSKMTVDALATSSQHLEEVRSEFKGMNHVISQAHNLLTKYGRREFTDKLLIFAAFAFFVACVLYVIQKRLF